MWISDLFVSCFLFNSCEMPFLSQKLSFFEGEKLHEFQINPFLSSFFGLQLMGNEISVNFLFGVDEVCRLRNIREGRH
jgi:hypothetical protein